MPADGTPSPSAVKQEGRLATLPFHWLLFAAYPVLFLYSQNIGELEPDELLLPLLITVAIAAVAMLLLTRFLDARRAAIIVSGLVVLVCLFGPISDNIHRLLPGTAVRLLAAGAVAVLLVVLALRLRGGLGTATLVLDVLSVVLVAFALVPIAQQAISLATAGPDDADSAAPITATGPGTDRDIWWFILDRYGSDASIQALYGIEDNDFGPWLESKGFQDLRDAHANYVRTSLSIASTLHMSHLDTLAERMGADNTKYGPIYKMLLDHPVGRFLQAQGYRYTQVGSWFPQTRESDIADAMLRPGVSADFGTLVWDATIVPPIQRLIAPAAKDDETSRAVTSANYQWDQLGRLCTQVGHNFVFAHVLLPHPPYVFHADGTVAPPGKITSYDEQMRYTNDHMRRLVECLQDRPADQQPIIVIQADEGPYPPRYAKDGIGFDWSTATGTELLAKYSILDQVYLPGLPEGVAPPPSTLSSVNTFRYLFDSYFGTDLPLLPDTSHTSPKLTPYDLTDVTDRIPSVDASLAPVPRPGDNPGTEPIPESSFEP